MHADGGGGQFVCGWGDLSWTGRLMIVSIVEMFLVGRRYHQMLVRLNVTEEIGTGSEAAVYC